MTHQVRFQDVQPLKSKNSLSLTKVCKKPLHHLTSLGMKGVKKQSNILNMENVKLESMVDTISFMLCRRNSMAG